MDMELAFPLWRQELLTRPGAGEKTALPASRVYGKRLSGEFAVTIVLRDSMVPWLKMPPP